MAQSNGKAAEQIDGHLDGHKEEHIDGVGRHRDPPCVAHSLRREKDEEPQDIVSSTFITIHTLESIILGHLAIIHML